MFALCEGGGCQRGHRWTLEVEVGRHRCRAASCTMMVVAVSMDIMARWSSDR